MLFVTSLGQAFCQHGKLMEHMYTGSYCHKRQQRAGLEV